jgi:hypothetical protein
MQEHTHLLVTSVTLGCMEYFMLYDYLTVLDTMLLRQTDIIFKVLRIWFRES